jgi:hypothetical protein
MRLARDENLAPVMFDFATLQVVEEVVQDSKMAQSD